MGAAGAGDGGSVGVAGTGRLGTSSALVGDMGPPACGSVPAAVCDGDVCSSPLGGSASLGEERTAEW